MRYLFFTCSFSFFLSLSYAGKITGIISDNDGKTLPYASVFIKGSNRGTNANSEGKFSLNFGPGQYNLLCQHVGYKKEERTITVGNDNMQVDFKLSLQEMVLGEVVVKNGEDPAYVFIHLPSLIIFIYFCAI